MTTERVSVENLKSIQRLKKQTFNVSTCILIPYTRYNASYVTEQKRQEML